MLLWIPASPLSLSDALTAPFWRRNFVAVTPSGRRADIARLAMRRHLKGGGRRHREWSLAHNVGH